jgi:hypothetical protein
MLASLRVSRQDQPAHQWHEDTKKKSGAGIPEGTPTPLGGAWVWGYGCRSSVPQLAGWKLTPLSLAWGQ